MDGDESASIGKINGDGSDDGDRQSVYSMRKAASKKHLDNGSTGLAQSSGKSE